MSWCNPCPPAPCPPQYQPLPISTGNVGIDRCGNIDVYAAPAVVHRPVQWPCWPIPNQQPGWPFSVWGGGGGGSWQQVLTGGAALANWMIQQRRSA